jgi:hypothetical protein
VLNAEVPALFGFAPANKDLFYIIKRICASNADLLDLSSSGIKENFDNLIKKFTTIYDDDGQKFLIAE